MPFPARLFVAFLVAALHRPTLAQTPSRAVVGQIGGEVSAIAVSGNYALAGEGYRLTVYDISNPSAATPIGFTLPFTDQVRGVTISGVRAYVAAGESGLHVIDFSTPSNPTRVGGWSSPGSAEAIVMNGTTAYLADGPFGLQVLDVSVPQNPIRVGSLLDDTFVFDAAISGNTLFLAAAGNGLLIADITTPQAPQHIASLDTPGWARAVAVSGSHVVVADSWEDVRIINVANRLAPFESDSVATMSWAMDVATSGSSALVADGSTGLAVLDISNPAAATQIGTLAAGGDALGIASSGNTALLADGRGGLYVINIATPASPQLLSVETSVGDGLGVSATPSHAYVAGGGGITIVDITDATHPEPVATFGDFDDYGNFVATANGYAYFGVTGLLITLNVSNPSAPVETSRVGLGTGAFRDITVSGTLLLVALETDLVILDISTPSAPVLRSRILEWGPVGVSVVGQYAYVAQSLTGMAVVNIADPQAPSVVATYKPRPEFNAAAVEAISGYAFAGSDVIDISNPASPQFVASLPVEPYRLNRSGNTLLAAAGTDGVYEIDISNPASPLVTHRTILPGFVSEVAAAGSNLAVSVARSGLWILGGSGPALISEAPLARAVRQGTPRSMRKRRDHPRAPVAMSVPRPVRASSQIVVNSTADSGTGTLRAAILAAVSGDSITFDTTVFPPAAPAIITPLTALPWPAGNVTIDASNAGVIVKGNQLASGENGLNLGSDGNIVRGLQIINFPGSGIHVGGSSNTIDGVLSSGHGEVGIQFSQTGTASSVVGSIVGLPPAGQTLRFEQPTGIGFSRATGNTVGGSAPADRNVIAGNQIDVSFIVARSNKVIGNYIGTDVTGTQVAPAGTRPASQMGVNLEGASQDNVVTDNVIASENAISGASDTGTSYNRFERNRIGVTPGGVAISGLTSANLGIGIDIAYNLAANNIIGAQVAAIIISGPGEIFVLGNRIGTDPTGTTAIPNTNPGGAVVATGARRAFIEGNIISGNGGAGLALRGLAVANNFVLGNVIGRNVSGNPLPNSADGISIESSQGNFIQRNTIANNAAAGISLTGAAANRIRRNAITNNGSAGISAGSATGLAEMPIILSSTSTAVNGEACANCQVEIFSDAANEGALYEMETTANASGAWTANKPSGLTGARVTAIATAANGGSSTFSNSVVLNGTPPAVPTGLDAGASSTSSVSLQWNAAGGATHYLIGRRSDAESLHIITSVSGTSLSDSPLASQIAYLYRIRAIGDGGASAYSSPALATTTLFTDDPILASTTVVRRAHLLELRTALTAVSSTAGLAAPVWTDPAITQQMTPIRSVHLSELRERLVSALNALGIPPPSFASPVTQGNTIRASNVQEIRDAVR